MNIRPAYKRYFSTAASLVSERPKIGPIVTDSVTGMWRKPKSTSGSASLIPHVVRQEHTANARSNGEFGLSFAARKIHPLYYFLKP
jgi:hypothetical protein